MDQSILKDRLVAAARYAGTPESSDNLGDVKEVVIDPRSSDRHRGQL